jgi:hypothetical protein
VRAAAPGAAERRRLARRGLPPEAPRRAQSFRRRTGQRRGRRREPGRCHR